MTALFLLLCLDVTLSWDAPKSTEEQPYTYSVAHAGVVNGKGQQFTNVVTLPAKVQQKKVMSATWLTATVVTGLPMGTNSFQVTAQRADGTTIWQNFITLYCWTE